MIKKFNILDHKGKFFEVLQTTKLSQVAVMTISPGSTGGPMETHEADQIFYVIQGEAEVTLDKEKTTLKEYELVIVPKGIKHHVKSTGKKDLFYLTVYAPPEY